MTDTQSDDEPKPMQMPLWCSATMEDAEEVDIEAPIRDIKTADCEELWSAYHEASQRAVAEDNIAEGRIYSLLAATVHFHFRPNDPNSPFGAMLSSPEGRSAIPEDFRGSHAELIGALAPKAALPALRARLCDLAWLLNKRRVDLGRLAIAAYVDVVESVKNGESKFRFRAAGDFTCRRARELMTRALRLAGLKSIGPEAEEAKRAKAFALQLFANATSQDDSLVFERFTELVLDFRLEAPEKIGGIIEDWINRHEGLKGQGLVDLLRLAARAYHRASQMEHYHQCKVAVADELASMADRILETQNSAMIAASHLSEAIAELHSVPDAREKRRKLKHHLVDVQSGIPDEMQSFSHELDLTAIAEDIQSRLSNLSLREMLFLFAVMGKSPSPEKLRADAIQTVEEHPLSSLFGTSLHDREGKVVYKSEGAGLQETVSDEELRIIISRAETIRRQVHSAGQVEAARQYINERFYLSDDVFENLLRRSGFVPNDLLQTFCRGFTRFFQGDFTSALFILTPLLENSLRYVLKSRGHDVSSFDNATKTQQDLTISALFTQMRAELDEIFGPALTTDIDNVFLSKPGPSLRHDVAHGLLHDGTPYSPDAIYACWLIFRLCLIPLFRYRDQIELPE